MLETYLPAGVAILFGLGLAGVFLAGAMLLGPKRDTAIKRAPFECGCEPIGTPRVRFSVRFYQAAILFLVFDIEVAFLYPWSVLFRDLSCAGPRVAGVCSGGLSMFGFVEMLVFVAVLFVALLYVLRKRAIGWD